MANPVFPTLTLTKGGQDSTMFSVKPEDVAIKSELEGGYVATRARHTRKPRRTFNTGYKSISDADRKTLLAFYETVAGGTVIFDWTDPVDSLVWQVRFIGDLDFKYVGMGTMKLWDVGFQLQQA